MKKSFLSELYYIKLCLEVFPEIPEVLPRLLDFLELLKIKMAPKLSLRENEVKIIRHIIRSK
jgi:hypothetical protein